VTHWNSILNVALLEVLDATGMAGREALATLTRYIVGWQRRLMLRHQ
jgi:hypothetical protein